MAQLVAYHQRSSKMIQKQPTMPKKAQMMLYDLTSYFWHKELHSKSCVILIRNNLTWYFSTCIFIILFSGQKKMNFPFQMRFYFKKFFLYRLLSKQSFISTQKCQDISNNGNDKRKFSKSGINQFSSLAASSSLFSLNQSVFFF